MVAERKYTDRDVREDATLKQIAEDYVLNYGGDYEPLVNAIEIMRESGSLPTHIIRVVLNCMRHDRHYASTLPAPMAEVIDMPSPRRRLREPNPVEQQCNMKTPHYAHGMGMTFCRGVPWEINRDVVEMAAHVKARYVAAPHGTMLHIAEGLAYTKWYPWDIHQYGEHVLVDLHVKLMCKYPSWLKNPRLFTEDDDIESLVVAATLEPMPVCEHCLEVIKHA